MSKANKKRVGPGRATALVILGLAGFALVLKHMLLGNNVSLFNPQGTISQEQHGLFVLIGILLIFAAVPVVIFLYFVAWKFRESNTKTLHRPHTRDNRFLNLSIWAYPIVFFFVFAVILVPATHRLEPRKALASDAEPLTIQVVTMDWKWVFLYPEQNIATVNFIQIPKDRPIMFELTADNAPMSSFWIPNLGGQLYTMTGHVNRLNLMAEKEGEFPGRTSEINGEGFAQMTFTAKVTDDADFTDWVQQIHNDKTDLTNDMYTKLLQPSEHEPVAMYGGYPDDLYTSVVAKYSSHNHGSEKTEEMGREH